jgi:hypothetical protein
MLNSIGGAERILNNVGLDEVAVGCQSCKNSGGQLPLVGDSLKRSHPDAPAERIRALLDHNHTRDMDYLHLNTQHL